MNAQEWKQLISAYADNALSPEEFALAQKLLAERPECKAYLAQLRKLSVSLETLKDEHLSPDAEMKILANAKKERAMIRNLKAPVLLMSIFVIVGVVSLQTYSQRSLQGKVKDAAQFIGGESNLPSSAAQNVKVSGDIDTKYINRQHFNLGLKNSSDQLGDQYSPVLASSPQPGVRRFKAGKVESLQVDADLSDNSIYSQASVQLSGGPVRSVMGKVSGGDIALADKAYNYEGYVAAIPTAANTEEYAKIDDNKFLMASESPLSTFSIDVDTASYSNMRRFLANNQMPLKDAVRVEEMINYFTYNYPKPEGNDPFAVTTHLALCPWKKDHQLLQIAIKGRTPEATKLPPSNLVFLIDVSGSMMDTDKLPLLKDGMKMMVNQLRPEDKVSLVVYAGNAGKVLEPTPGSEKSKIIAAIDNLQAGGSTAGGEGILLAYQTAKENFMREGNNRVVLATDGDFNVGVSRTSELTRLIEDKRKDGVFLTVLGFGQGNYKDNRMEELADKGNGNYYYIDTIKEARKVLVDELGSTLFTIAKDVKIQIEFNPAAVKAYRLIGYENRVMAKEDFNDDKKDAGEIGAGHTVTALYEIVPAGSEEKFGNTDDLKYQKTQQVSSNEVMTVKLRYKEPTSDTSKLITQTIQKSQVQEEPTGDFAWASTVAEFGMLLRDSEFKGSSTYEDVLKRARANIGEDKFGFRNEFVSLVETARNIAPSQNGQINFK